MLLSSFLEGHPMKAAAQWEEDLGPITGEQMGGGPSSCQHLFAKCITKCFPIIYSVEGALYTSKTTQNGKITRSIMQQVQECTR